MSPAIFIEDFERTENSDELHSMLGRLLILATRFDSQCKQAAIMIKMKDSIIPLLVDNDELFDKFASEVYSKCKNLNKNIDSLDLPAKYVVVLKDAKGARNKVAHDISIGLEGCIDSAETENRLTREITECAIDLAYGDIAISSFISVNTNEPLLNNQFMSTYKDSVVKWVVKRYE